MKNLLFACLILFTGASSLCATPNAEAGKNKKADWNLVLPGEGGRYELLSVSPEEFVFKMTVEEAVKPVRAQLCRTINKQMHSQNKLIFECRTVNDVPVELHFVLSYKDGMKSVTKFGPRLQVKSREFKTFVLGVDTEFRLGDALFHIWQLKVTPSMTGAVIGTVGGVEMRNLRFAKPEEAGIISGKNEIIVHPLSRPQITTNTDALKIYFHFDNEDYGTVFGGRGKAPVFQDRCQYPGFRDMLLETVRDQATIVASPEEADLIICSVARPDPAIAVRIAAAVRNGTPLLAAGEVADPEIAALLPVTVMRRTSDRLPDRAPIRSCQKNDVRFAGLNPACFGMYWHVQLKPGSRTLLEYGDGTSALVEGNAENGRVWYCAFGFGSDLVPGKTAHDAFLLRAISELSGRKLREEPRKIAMPDADGYMPGFSGENFGRFGFALGDGLLVESINNFLGVINGGQEYGFSSASLPKITISKWEVASVNAVPPLSERKVDHLFKYSGIGKFRWNSSLTIPEKWRDKTVVFAVEGGIDDTAEVYFNDTLIGKVTADMPEYWKRPHRYQIDPSLIRFGAENLIRIETENLRGQGGFGTCPELIALSGRNESWKLTPDRINALGKGGVIIEPGGSSRRFDTSLAFPGVRWEIFSDYVEMGLHNIVDFAAYPTSKGVCMTDLRKITELSSDWSGPWLLLFRRGVERPLLMVFDRRPETIKIHHTGEAVSGLGIRRTGGIGMILPLWLYGRQTVDSTGWLAEIPEETLRRIAFWVPRATLYPVAIDESFRIDEARKKVLIRSRFSYHQADGEWAIKDARPFAPVPPLAYFTKGMLFESEEAKDENLVTSYGSYAAHDNSDTVNWSLPLPEPVLSAIPGVTGFLQEEKIANELFADGVRFMAGGGVRQTDWTPAYPQGKKFKIVQNMNLHGYLHGAAQVVTTPYLLNEVNRGLMARRLLTRIFEPIELYQYKAATRWREEPMSGIRYPIYFNNRHVHGTKYAAGTGTVMNYADANETAYMILTVMQALADRYGQRDFVLANGNFIRHVARLLLVSDDYGYLACHCRESGQSATIDMLNCEYSAMMKLARLAEILGDEPLRRQALYRGARRMVPTLGRFGFGKYAAENGLTAYPEAVAFCVGFSEDSFSFRTKGTPPSELDLYDMSQGIPLDIAPLYRKYLNGVQELVYFQSAVYPKLFNADGNYRMHESLLSILAQDSEIAPEILRKAMTSKLADVAFLKRRRSDWGGMAVSAYLAEVLFCLVEKPLRIHTAKDLDLRCFEYDPMSKTLYITFTPGKYAELLLETSMSPLENKIHRNEAGLFVMPITDPGKERQLEIRFHKD